MTRLRLESTIRKPEFAGPARSSAGQRDSAAGLPAELELLKDLWERQRAYLHSMDDAGANHEYLAAHFAMELSLLRKLATIDWLAREIRPMDRVLEWGCQHALDSCIYRRRFGPSIELHGCDVVPPQAYRPFHAYSGIDYRPLTHPYRLDYPSNYFDVVTSNGVWEHVPDEDHSLQEIHRVIRPGGLFLVACLPNRYSYTEAIQRRLGHTAHDRLYTIAQARRQLHQAGFVVERWEYRFLVPTMLNGFPRRIQNLYQKLHKVAWAANAILERIYPVNRIASNLMLKARKPTGSTT